MIHRLFLTTTALLAFSGAAFASDLLPTSKPAPIFPASPYSWSGFYFGATAGAGGIATKDSLDYEGDSEQA
jgi:hypothetical protein